MIAEWGDFRGLVPPSPARLVLSDPPYNIGHDYGEVSDKLGEQEYLSLLEDFATWAYGNTLEDAHLFVVLPEKTWFFHGAAAFVAHAEWDYRQTISWVYPQNIGHSARKFTSAKRQITWFTKGTPEQNVKADPEPYQNPTDRRVRSLIEAGSPGRAPYDWWLLNIQKNVGADHAGYANQLPRPLLRRIILTATKPGELVADPFGGTGSTAREAEALARIGWTCDLNRAAPCFARRLEDPFLQGVDAE